MTAGLPDIVACVNGQFLGLETKLPGERGNVSRIQAHVHSKIGLSGGFVRVVCSVAEAEALVKEIRGMLVDDARSHD